MNLAVRRGRMINLDGRSGERVAANVDRDSVTLKVAVNGGGRYGTLGRMCPD